MYNDYVRAGWQPNVSSENTMFNATTDEARVDKGTQAMMRRFPPIAVEYMEEIADAHGITTEGWKPWEPAVASLRSVAIRNGKGDLDVVIGCAVLGTYNLVEWQEGEDGRKVRLTERGRNALRWWRGELARRACKALGNFLIQ